MAKFRHEKPKPILFPKKQKFFKAISSLYAAKASCFNNVIKRLKLILSLFWVPLSRKTSKQVFFPKKIIKINFMLLQPAKNHESSECQFFERPLLALEPSKHNFYQKYD